MSEKKVEKTLTGLERQMVIDYLKNENVSITLKSDSLVFPKVIKSENFQILEKGILLIDENDDEIKNLSEKNVRIQFYFNRLALYFEAIAKTVSKGLAFVIPAEIKKVSEEGSEKPSGFYATIFLETKSDQNQVKTLGIDCPSDSNFPLFAEQKLEDISDDDEKLEKSKEYIKENLNETEKDKIQPMIPICRYFFDSDDFLEEESVQNRFHPPKIIFASPTHLVFASKKTDMPLSDGSEYGILLHFPLKKTGLIKERKVYLSCAAEKTFENQESEKLCVLAKFTKVTEEDERFLKEFNS